MLGNNPKRPPEQGDGSFLFVKNIFLTIQGEGIYTGHPSIFIRLGGCNLACTFCDTDFEDFVEKSVEDIINSVLKLDINLKKPLIVITGGEPFRQPIGKLCKALIQLGYKIQIETNGTLFHDAIPEKIDIICSPKCIKSVYIKPHPLILPRISAFKFLISKTLPGYDHVPLFAEGKITFVQPMDEYDITKNKENEKLAIDLALRYGYILSYQIHKKLGIE